MVANATSAATRMRRVERGAGTADAAGSPERRLRVRRFGKAARAGQPRRLRPMRSATPKARAAPANSHQAVVSVARSRAPCSSAA